MKEYNVIVSDKKKYVYFRIPKVATVSIGMILKENTNISHESFDSYWNTNWNTYFKFSIVRNPWDRLLSCFLDKTKKSIGTIWEMEFYKPLSNFSFDQFIEMLTPKYISYDGHLKQQVELIDTNNIDYLGRFENINYDLKNILDTLNISVQNIPKENTTEHTHYHDYYNTKTRNLVYNLYKEDIEAFKYEY
jgi:hypothetical protein